eukprot:665793-Pelagomonas_calceolata.AAC.2
MPFWEGTLPEQAQIACFGKGHYDIHPSCKRSPALQNQPALQNRTIVQLQVFITAHHMWHGIVPTPNMLCTPSLPYLKHAEPQQKRKTGCETELGKSKVAWRVGCWKFSF